MTRGPRRRTLISGALTLALTVSLTGLTAGCSLFQGPPEPGPTAQQFATGLAKADLSGVPLTGMAPAQATKFITAAFQGMGDLRPTVTVTDIAHNADSDHATATLFSRWDVSGSEKDWGYETQVGLRLIDDVWQVTWDPMAVAPELRADEALTLVHRWPKRADILDGAGTAIMTEREVVSVGIDKANAGAKAAASATSLADIVGVDAKAFAAKVSAAGPKAFVPAISLRTTDPTLTRNVDRINAVTGALQVSQLQVLGPTRTWAAPILGTVSEATAEQIQKSGGTLEPGDSVGQQGLQLRYDAQLRGTPGLAVQAVTKGADGSVINKRELFAQVSTEGVPLETTFDSTAQNAAEAALADQTGHPTALVAVRVSTGEVLAAAVGPGAKGAPLALAGAEAPGSTFKIVSSLANIRKGATAATLLPCTDTLTVNGRVFGNYSAYPKDKLGDIPMATALAYSCNTAFISQHLKVSQADLASAAESLGLGQKLDLPFTGSLGSVPPTADPVEHAASFIGQGRIEASPLAMALVTASVMRGSTVRPILIKGADALPPPATPLTAAEAKVLRTEMQAVVTEGSGKVLAAVGVEFAKTGTAEFGTATPPQTHAWMVAGRGDIAIAAYNELGPSGTTDAAPFIIKFLKAYDLL